MRKITLILLFVLSMILCSQSTLFAMTIDEVDEYNNLYYPLSVYNGGINTAPQKSSQEAYVDPATGSTHVKVTDISLPGVNGFDLNLTRLYDSSNSTSVQKGF